MKSFVDALQEEIARLTEENRALKTHEPYGIMTRAAFELEKRNLKGGQYVVFGDIDDMHGLNTQYGYEEVNNKIRNALQVRSEDLLLTGLLFSGDEIVFVISGDPVGFGKRLQSSFIENGLSITLGYSKIENGDTDTAINKAAKDVQITKVGRNG